MKDVNLVKIYNIQGKMISSHTVNNGNTLTIDVSRIQEGLYYLAGYNSSNQLVSNAKFVVKTSSEHNVEVPISLYGTIRT